MSSKEIKKLREKFTKELIKLREEMRSIHLYTTDPWLGANPARGI
jgi:hypothetical protein